MRDSARILTVLIASLALSSSVFRAVAAPQDDWQALKKEQDADRRAFEAVYQAASNDEERDRAVQTKYPQPSKYADRALAIGRSEAKDPAVVEALVWLVQQGRDLEQGKQALKLIQDRHLGSPQIREALAYLAFSNDSSTDELLRAALDKSPDAGVRAAAALTLARSLKNRGKTAEAESLLELCRGKYAAEKDWSGTVGEAAEAELFEIRNLAIGMVAPDIEGEDVEGKRFKLSEHRGKVVVIDFWGDW